MKNNDKTDFLLPEVSFWTGLGSIFAISGNYYSFNTSKSGVEADYRALESDWKAVGKDFEVALEIKLNELNETSKEGACKG